jgi:hypothetical protein
VCRWIHRKENKTDWKSAVSSYICIECKYFLNVSFAVLRNALVISYDSMEERPSEKPIFAQLLKKSCPPFYWTQMLITVFTKARRWTLCWIIWIDWAFLQHISLIHFNIIVTSAIRSPYWFFRWKPTDDRSNESIQILRRTKTIQN